MALLEPFQLPAQSDIQQVLCRQAIQNIIYSNFLQIQNNFNALYNAVYNNPNLTPQQVMDSFDVDASMVVNFLNSMQSLINSAQPGMLKQVIPDLVQNPDGTVVVSMQAQNIIEPPIKL